MLRELRQFTSLHIREKLILIQVWLLLGWTRIAVLTVSFKCLAARLEHCREFVPTPASTAEQIQQATRIGWLVSVAARYTPWQSRCLTQVLVAQRLLAGRNIPGQFYLGVRRRSECLDDSTRLSAHAWLQCGDVIVNGAAGHEAYTVVSTFRWGPGEMQPADGRALESGATDG
jgi:Transglutaminase-like superfamily